jgi:predicted phage terminase large subunit-like protein
MKHEIAELDAAMRRDFHSFAQRCFMAVNPGTVFLDNWHLQLIAAKLEDCRHGRCKRLIINLPPRSLKSILASVAFPAWLLGHDPTMRIICASYGQDLAAKHAADCRLVVEDPFFRRTFAGTRLSSSRPTTADLMTTKRGGRLAISVGGPVTGRGGDIVIIDDPQKPDEANSDVLRTGCNNWYDTTLLSRLDNHATGVIILIMQRLHLDDLVGHVQQQGVWEVLSLPAIATEDETHRIWTPYGEYTHVRKAGEPLHPQRMSLAELEAMRVTVGSFVFAGQYQQDPVPQGGGLVKLEWFKTYQPDDLPTTSYQVVQSWDTATQEKQISDYSVCTTWHVRERKAYLVDVLRKRMEYPELKRTVAQQAARWNADMILIENKSSGIQLIQELRFDGVSGLQEINPQGDKVMRMQAQTAMIESGRVLLPAQAPWLSTYLGEVTSFPMSRYKDQVDSTSQALAWINKGLWGPGKGLYYYYKAEAERLERERGETSSSI